MLPPTLFKGALPSFFGQTVAACPDCLILIPRFHSQFTRVRSDRIQTMTLATASLIVISVDENYRSVFSEESFDQAARGDLWISEQQSCLNLRFRSSPAGYQSGWHVAGDPTLIIVTGGCMEIELRDGSKKQFRPGEKFIARDDLPNSLDFDHERHGHRARVMGERNSRRCT